MRTKQCATKDMGPNRPNKRRRRSAINSSDVAAKKERRPCKSSDDGAAKKKRKPSKSSSDGAAKKKLKYFKSSGEGDSESDFVSQCRPKGLRNLIQLLNDQQKDDVKSIGFGGILELQLSKCSNHKMLLWLVENFNCSGCMLTVDNFRSFAITPDDIYDVLMLPRNEGVPVLKYARTEESTLLVHLKDKYGIKTAVPLRVLFEVLRNDLSAGGDDFKRIFVLYCLDSFLTPSSNRLARTHVLKSVESVENISKLDWCSYILSNLRESVRLFQTRASKNVGGCILLLQIIYFHRLKWQGFDEPCTLPLIQHWTDRKVSNRCIQEIQAGKYGCGELSVNMFPRSANGVLKNTGGIHDSESGKGDSEDDSESAARSRERKQAYMDELENKVSCLEEEIERLKAQQGYTDELENKVSLLEEEIERLKTHQAYTHELENNVSHLEEENESLKIQQAYTHELENKVPHPEEEIERLKNQQDYTLELENKVSHLEEENERLKRQQAYRRELENKVPHLEEEIERLKKQLAYTHELESKVSCQEEEIEGLKRQQEAEVEVLHCIPVQAPKEYQLRRTSSAPILRSAFPSDVV